MKNRVSLLSIVFLCIFASGDELRMRLVPRGRPFRTTFADPREIKMALSFEGDSRINAAIGNYFSLFSIETDDQDSRFHLGLEGAGFFSLRQADRRFPLESSDGLIGVYGEGESGLFQWQLRYTHISAHLADGSEDVPIAYSREHLAARIGLFPLPELHVYGGMYYVLNAIPEVPPWSIQLGFDYFAKWRVAQLTPFVGIDLKWKTESDANPTLSVQSGIALSNPREAYRSLRLFYAYHTGADPRGQHYQRTVTSHALGLEMQI